MSDPVARPAEDPIDERELEAIVSRGPKGAFALAGLAAAIVAIIFYLFYFLVYLQRGVTQ